MTKFYHISAKKATFCLILGIFLLIQPASAKIPNDPEYQATMWEQIGMPTAWDYSVGSRKVIVAIIDTGADTWHNDLRDNIWINPNEVPNNGIDDDRNGYVDDINGWNFIEKNNDVRTSVFGVDNDPNAVQHGTILAGLVGAAGGNNLNGVGVNWRVQIMPLRAVNSEGQGSVADVANAVNYAVDNGASVISLSLVTDSNDIYLKQVLRRAYDVGVVVVAAAGNEQTSDLGDLDKNPLYPICLDQGDVDNWILGVSSVNASDRLSYFADFGKCVDILAPGESISSTERYAPAYNYLEDFGGKWKGTSFSVPIVAGAAALIKSIRPDWGAKEIIRNLLDNADSVEEVNPIFIGRLGYGRLNVGRAAAGAFLNRPKANLIDTIYFYSGNEFFGYKFNERYAFFIGNVPEAKILDIASADVNNDNKKEIVLLISRKPYFYVRVVNESGVLLNEFALQGAKDARKVKIYSDVSENSYLVTELYDKKNNRTILGKYDWNGNKFGELAIKNVLSNWDISSDGNLIIAFKNKKDLSIKYLNWDNKTLGKWDIPKIDSVDDLKILHEANIDEDKILLVYRQGKDTLQMAISVVDGKKRSEKIVSKNKDKWHLLAGNFGGDDGVGAWRFQLNGGLFPVYDYYGKLVKDIKMLKISGGVE